MLSDKTFQEIIYPVLKVSLFIASSFILLFALNMFLGTKEDYDRIIRDHMWSRVFAKGLVFLIVHSLTLFILFIISKVCRIVINRKTYLWLLIIYFNSLRNRTSLAFDFSIPQTVSAHRKNNGKHLY